MKPTLIILKLNKGKYEEVEITPQQKEEIFSIVEAGIPEVKPKLNTSLEKVLLDNPYLNQYMTYFSKIKQNNAYVTIMRHNISEVMKRLNIHPTVIGVVLSVSRSSVIVYKDSKIQYHPHYNEVVTIMNKMIKENKYPYSRIKKMKDSETNLTIYDWVQEN